jgi:glycosyltransferase involved in cell wall biosynthesis
MSRMQTAESGLMRPLRVSVVTETWPPEVNGVAVTLAQLVSALVRAGHDIRLIRPRQRPDDAARDSPLRDVLVGGLTIPHYPHLRMGVPCVNRLRALWRTAPPDLVHIATEGPLGWSALRAARSFGIPVSTDFRTNFHAYSAHYGLNMLRGPVMSYLRWFHNAADCTMVPTDQLRSELVREGLERLTVVGRGIDTHRFQPGRRDTALRRQWTTDANTLLVGYVGRLAAEKNLEAVAEAFAGIRAARPGTRLVVVGDGPARGELAARCPDAIFVGSKHGDELAAHHASVDLLLFPSRTETFGNVAVEAMASGVPVVAFDYAAAGQLIKTGVNGWLAPLAEPQRYAAIAARAIRDHKELAAIGQQARATVMALNWDAIATQVESLWRTLLSPDRPLSVRHQPR